MAGYDEWLQDETDLLVERASAGIAFEDSRSQLDNQNWALRQHLLYHMLNYTLTPSDMVANAVSNVSIETTLLFPLLEPPELPPTPPPGPPWLPRGGQGLLGGHGQRIRLARAGSAEGGERGRIGVDHNGHGGIGVWDGSGWTTRGNDSEWAEASKNRQVGARWTRNGVVVGIDGVLEPPPSLGESARKLDVPNSPCRQCHTEPPRLVVSVTVALRGFDASALAFAGKLGHRTASYCFCPYK
jgi:hypothetical protein